MILDQTVIVSHCLSLCIVFGSLAEGVGGRIERNANHNQLILLAAVYT